MSGVKTFSGEGQGKIHHVIVAKEKVTPFMKKRVVTSEKITPSKEFGRGTKQLDDM